MPDYNVKTEPIFAGETEEQYRNRLSNIDAAELASEKRIWQRKKLEEIHKAQVGLNSILQHMTKYIPSCDAVMALAHYTELCRNKPKTSNNIKQPTVMKNETITIEAPEGHVIDKENSTDTVIRFKKVESNKRPMSFLEIKNIKGFYVDDMSSIRAVDCLNRDNTKNTWPTVKLSEAALALSQLLQLRDAWNEGNTEEMLSTTQWHGINNQRGKACTYTSNFINIPLRFKTEETRDAFLKQFRPLIETALPLL